MAQAQGTRPGQKDAVIADTKPLSGTAGGQDRVPVSQLVELVKKLDTYTNQADRDNQMKALQRLVPYLGEVKDQDVLRKMHVYAADDGAKLAAIGRAGELAGQITDFYLLQRICLSCEDENARKTALGKLTPFTKTALPGAQYNHLDIIPVESHFENTRLDAIKVQDPEGLYNTIGKTPYPEIARAALKELARRIAGLAVDARNGKTPGDRSKSAHMFESAVQWIACIFWGERGSKDKEILAMARKELEGVPNLLEKGRIDMKNLALVITVFAKDPQLRLKALSLSSLQDMGIIFDHCIHADTKEALLLRTIKEGRMDFAAEKTDEPALVEKMLERVAELGTNAAHNNRELFNTAQKAKSEKVALAAARLVKDEYQSSSLAESSQFKSVRDASLSNLEECVPKERHNTALASLIRNCEHTDTVTDALGKLSLPNKLDSKDVDFLMKMAPESRHKAETVFNHVILLERSGRLSKPASEHLDSKLAAIALGKERYLLDLRLAAARGIKNADLLVDVLVGLKNDETTYPREIEAREKVKEEVTGLLVSRVQDIRKPEHLAILITGFPHSETRQKALDISIGLFEEQRETLALSEDKLLLNLFKKCQYTDTRLAIAEKLEERGHLKTVLRICDNQLVSEVLLNKVLDKIRSEDTFYEIATDTSYPPHVRGPAAERVSDIQKLYKLIRHEDAIAVPAVRRIKDQDLLETMVVNNTLKGPVAIEAVKMLEGNEEALANIVKRTESRPDIRFAAGELIKDPQAVANILVDFYPLSWDKVSEDFTRMMVGKLAQHPDMVVYAAGKAEKREVRLALVEETKGSIFLQVRLAATAANREARDYALQNLKDNTRSLVFVFNTTEFPETKEAVLVHLSPMVETTPAMDALKILGMHGPAGVALKAIERLGQTQSDYTNKALIELAESGRPSIKIAAVKALNRQPEPLVTLCGSKEREIRIAAVQQLAGNADALNKVLGIPDAPGDVKAFVSEQLKTLGAQ